LMAQFGAYGVFQEEDETDCLTWGKFLYGRDADNSIQRMGYFFGSRIAAKEFINEGFYFRGNGVTDGISELIAIPEEVFFCRMSICD